MRSGRREPDRSHCVALKFPLVFRERTRLRRHEIDYQRGLDTVTQSRKYRGWGGDETLQFLSPVGSAGKVEKTSGVMICRVRGFNSARRRTCAAEDGGGKPVKHLGWIPRRVRYLRDLRRSAQHQEGIRLAWQQVVQLFSARGEREREREVFHRDGERERERAQRVPTHRDDEDEDDDGAD